MTKFRQQKISLTYSQQALVKLWGVKRYGNSQKIFKQGVLLLSEKCERLRGEEFFTVYKIGYLKPKEVFKLHLVESSVGNGCFF